MLRASQSAGTCATLQSIMAERLRYWVPFSAGFFLIFAGVYLSGRFDIYERIAHFDKFMHLLGGFVAAWILDYFFYDELQHLGAFKIIVVLTAGACLIGVLWEFAEYASNYTQHAAPLWYSYFHGGDLRDTLGDLAADIVGAGLFVIPLLVRKNS